MDIKQRVEIISSDLDALKTEVEQGAGTSDSYTKAEADDKFAEKTNVYTKSEADNKFVEQGTPVEMDLTPITIALDSDNKFPADKLYVLQKHLPFKIGNGGDNLVFLGLQGTTGYTYGCFYSTTNTDTISVRKVYLINSETRTVFNWGIGGYVGDSLMIVCGQNFK